MSLVGEDRKQQILVSQQRGLMSASTVRIVHCFENASINSRIIVVVAIKAETSGAAFGFVCS